MGILGRIGSGKTTLQKLIMGLYQPTDGAVLIDGIDMRQLDLAELRQQIGYVPQDAVLFYGSLRENLVLAHPHADDAAILRAAKLAGLNNFVDIHPQGFDMPIGERGESLSGGQRKAVSLARAVIPRSTHAGVGRTHQLDGPLFRSLGKKAIERLRQAKNLCWW